MWRTCPVSLCLAVAYFATGYVGLMIPARGSTITLFWLPTGIAVAALRRWGLGCWPGVLTGAFAVNLAVGSPYFSSAGIAIGNTLGPLLARWILVRTGFATDLKRPLDILLLVLAAAAGMVVTASAGVTSLMLTGQLSDAHFSAWLIWWVGDVTGVIAAAPLVFTLNRASIRTLWIRRVEFAAWATSLVFGIVIVFFLNGA